MFPLYFQAFKPRFRLRVKKISDAGRERDGLRFYVEFADHAIDPFDVDVSGMSIGDQRTSETEPVLLSPSGDTRICLDTGTVPTGQSFFTLYSFVVSAEATLVFLLLSVVFGGLIAVLLRL